MGVTGATGFGDGMGLFLRLIVITIVGVLALILGAVLVVPSFVDWSDYRGAIENQVSDLTGRPVSIDGTVDFVVLPMPKLTATNVRVANAQGGVYPDFLNIQALEVRVRLWPLLTGNVDVDSVILVAPTLVLEMLPDGRPAYPELTIEALGRSSLAESTRVQRMSVADGTLVLRDGETDREERVSNVFAGIAADRLTGPATIEGGLTIRGIDLRVDGRIAEVTEADALPLNMNVRVDGLDGRTTVAGILSAESGFQGEVSASGSDLQSWINRFSETPLQVAGFEQPFSVSGKVDADVRVFSLRDAQFGIGDQEAVGHIILDRLVPGRGEIELSATQLDVDPFTPSAEQLQALLSDALRHQSPAWVEMLGGNLRLSVQSLQYAGSRLSDVYVDAVTDQGRLDIAQTSANLPGGGRFTAAGTVFAASDAPLAVDIAGEIDFGDLRTLIDWSGTALPEEFGADRLRTGSLSLAVEGDASAFTVPRFDLSLDALSINGEAGFQDGDRPLIRFRADADVIDLDQYIPDALIDLDADEVPEVPNAFSISAFPRASWVWDHFSEFLASADLDLKLSAQQVDIDGGRWNDVVWWADHSGSRVEIEQAQVKLPGDALLALSGQIDDLAAFDGVSLVGSILSDAPAETLAALSMPTPWPLDRLPDLELSGSIDGTGGALVVDWVGGGGPISYFSLAGTLGQAEEELALGLSARVRVEETADALRLLWPDYQEQAPLGLFDLSARLAGTPDRIAVSDLQGVFGAGGLAADGSVYLDGDRPYLELDIRINELAPLRFFPERAESERGRLLGRWSTNRFSLADLHLFDGALGVTANSLRLGDFEVDDPVAALLLEEGRLTIDGASGRIFDGDLGVTGAIEIGATEGAEFDIRADLVRADLVSLLSSAIGGSGIEGQVDIGADILSSGASISTLVAGTSGAGLVGIRDGKFEGLDLPLVGETLVTSVEPTPFLEGLAVALSGGESAFDSLNMPFEIGAGIATTDELRIVGPFGSGEGAGSMDFVRWQVDVATDVGFYAQPDAPPLTLRLVGDPGEPALRPSSRALEAYFTNLAAEALTRRLSDEAEAASDGSATGQ